MRKCTISRRASFVCLAPEVAHKSVGRVLFQVLDQAVLFDNELVFVEEPLDDHCFARSLAADQDIVGEQRLLCFVTIHLAPPMCSAT